MATLTTSWQSYATASWKAPNGNAKVTFYLEARYSSQNIENNTTTVYTRLRSEVLYSVSGSGYEFTCTFCDTRKGSAVWYFDDEVIISSPAKTITHNTDGTKNLSLSATAKNTYWGINKSMSATVTIPKINRLAMVTSSNDFTDEENPTLTFDNPAGFDVKPYLNFYNNNNVLVYSLSRNTIITSPYTWTITSEERSALRIATNQQQSYRVQVGVTTFNGNIQLGSHSIAKQMTYVNANPTQTVTATETNTKIVNLLGSSLASTIVQNASNLTFTVTPTALKSATITKVELDGVADTTSPYEFTNVVPTSNSFTIKTTDSRSLSVEETITKTLITYEPIDILSAIFERPSSTSDNVVLNAEIKYIQTTFGTTPNVPTIRWKKGEDGVLNTISASDYTIDTTNNKIIITNLILTNAISYQDENRFYFYVNDLLTEDEDSHNYVTKGIPTMDAGEHDLQINGDFFIANTNRQNPMNVKEKINWMVAQNVLWNGATYMNETQSIDLTDTPISSQPHGIVLVWCAYESGSAKDWDFVCNFIPKEFVSLKNGSGMLFNMMTPTFNNVGTKYLYIADTTITGAANNTATGTASGITYKNNHWVLRYVIGV